jgi:endonuclease/exonuclease/phosphatase family metal-dependent hydrolase
MKFIKGLIKLILVLLLLFGLLLGILTLTDFKPDEKVKLDINNNQNKQLTLNQEITMTSFNIGFAGLDKSQDFFADGGINSRAESKERVEANLAGIWNYLEKVDSDILFLQEVDLASSRSYKVNQLEFFSNKLADFSYIYGVNYRVPWVPVPLANPMGKVESGIMTFAKCKIEQAYRFDLPGKEKWPIQIFELDRCFTETRFKVETVGELVLINLHLSAFVEGGLIRQQQLGYLRDYLANESKKGNYIILGGDWNHNLPGSDPYYFEQSEEWPFWLQNLPADFTMEGFTWALDKDTPTVRTLARNYQPGYNFLAVIDGFLVSNNVEIINVVTGNEGFEYSDHNPVSITFMLK